MTMTMTRPLVLALSAALLPLVACSKDPAPSLGSQGGASTTKTSSYQDCSHRATAKKCSKEHYKPFDDCADQKCGSKYEACFGKDYTTGKFSGPCAEFAACEQKCDCAAGCIS